ncbi:hypothetical protein HID58_006506 [Brassica napus]|uniref:Uncharacterized protein n=1 Tax=Brassica napus TaxID=3708 RepID=A0ABQ8EBQ7_BRANA|nr:hypothetical protein HID58_006506 [Brassica napus]
MKFAELKTSQPSIDENVPVILSVSDDTGTEAFLGFDTEVAKLTHVLASEAAQIVKPSQDRSSTSTEVGSVTQARSSTSTSVGRCKGSRSIASWCHIVPARELAPMPTFAVPEALLPGAVAPGSDVRDANTCKVAEQATTPDGSLSGHLPAAKGQIDLEENAPKKARVD